MGTLVRGQRGKITDSHMEAIPETARDKANKMLVLLRLAVVFKWVERFEDLKDCDVAASSKELRLAFPQDWYEQHPLTTSELRSAGPSIGKLGIDLVLD